MSQLWNRLASSYDHTIGLVLRDDLPTIKQLAQFKPTDRVLDFAGGTGRIAQAIQSDVHQVIVADQSPNMVRQAKQKGLEAIATPELPLPFPDGSFDVILVIEAFHHFTRQDNTLAEFFRLLAPGGRLVLEEPNPEKMIRYGFWIERLFEPTRYSTPDHLTSVVMSHGFTTPTIQRVGWRYFLQTHKSTA